MRGERVAIWRVLLISMLLAVAIFAQEQQPGAASEPQSNQPARTTQQPAPNADVSGLNSPTFNQSVAEALMQKLADAMRTHNLSKTRELFDLPKFGPGFLDNITAAFNHYDRFEPFYRIEHVSGSGTEGTITSQFDLDRQSVQGTFDSGRKHAIMKLMVARVPVSGGREEWRITTMQPPDFLFHF
jgi:hypothetical protein